MYSMKKIIFLICLSLCINNVTLAANPINIMDNEEQEAIEEFNQNYQDYQQIINLYQNQSKLYVQDTVLNNVDNLRTEIINEINVFNMNGETAKAKALEEYLSHLNESLFPDNYDETLVSIMNGN